MTLSPDIAPRKKVEYTLTAEVADSSIGLIIDDNAACSDNVTEEGSGIQMPEDNLRASKDVDTRFYSSGDELTYTIRVDNDGDGFANQVPVIDDLTAVETTDINGNKIPAFISWQVTAQAFKSDGSVASQTDTGISGQIDSPKILDVTATIEPHSYVIYTIQAKTDPLANGHIQNSVTVDNSVYADRGSDPRDFVLQLNKTVKTNTDSNFRGDHTSYSKLENEITYQIHVKNPKGNGYATNVVVKDPISSISAGLLEPDSKSKAVFSSWTISAEIISDDPLLNGNAKYTKVGSFSDNADLDTVAQIAPNVEVVYTIVAQIDRSVGNEIIFKRFENTATIETKDSDSQSTASDTVVVHPKEPNVVVVKTAREAQFIPGQWVTFDITVFNRGAGYANEVSVKDDIKAMNVFSEWTIDAETDSNNSPYKSGSYADSKSAYPNNGNINSKIDIDPQVNGDMGYVRYTIRGLVKNDYKKDEISNTVEIHDPMNNLDQSATAEIGDSGDAKLNVSIVKTANTSHFVPGDEVIYEIVLLNNSDNQINDLKLVDPLTQISSVLANKKDNHFADYEDQSPFEYWEFDYGDGSWQGRTTEDLIYPVGNENVTFSLAAREQRVFRVKAKIKDNVIGSRNGAGVLRPIIANDAYIFRDYKQVDEESHVSHHEMERAASGGDTHRELLVNGSSSNRYKPGDTLTYKVKVSSNVGYFNNHKVQENITGVQVQLLDGSKANPFSDKFTVSVDKQDSNGGNGTTDGTLDGVVADNQNIDTTIDVAGKDYVVYTVEGIVRDDAAGDITIGGITVSPYDYHLTFTKTVDQKNYEPNKPLVYHLTVTNDGKGNAYQVPIKDELSSVMVDLIDGRQEQAFNNGWTIEPKVLGGSPVAEVDLDGTIANNKDIDTHISVPAGETIDYVVTARVHPQAVGDILNLLVVDGDTVSALSKPNTEKYHFEKRVINIYDVDGATTLTGGYTPGGYIEYLITLENRNNVHLKDVEIIDAISSITTNYFDGTTGQAFESWTIKTEVDTSGISDAGTVSNNTDINTQFDLAGSGFADSGTFVKYTVKAKVSEKAVGSIQNTARVEGKHNLPSERISMLPAEIKKLHKAYTDNAFGTHKTTFNHTAEGEKIVYRLRITNNGKGTEYGASLKETFSNVKTRLAQNAAGEANNQKDLVFGEFGWTVTASKSSELTTDIGSFVGGANSDIDIPVLSIAPQGWVEFVMESQIRSDALDKFAVAPLYNGQKFGNAKIEPEAQQLEVEKRIVSIGGKAYSKGDTYKPGDEVVYLLDVNNKAKVWTDQTAITDVVSDIKVEVLGGGIESAFDTFTITHTNSNGLDSDVDTYLPAYDPNTDLNIMTDIGPQEDLQFTIKGTIRSDALGEVEANRATVGNKLVVTPTIPPVEPNLIFEKVVTSTTADSNACSFPSNTGSGCQYNPTGQVVYQITVENIGEGIANDVKIIDKLNDIKTSTGANAFSDLSTTILQQPDPSRFSISGKYSGNQPLNATFDLMPGDKVVFGLQGTVDADATGTITNVAKVDGKNSNDVILDQGDSEILASKTTDTPTYIPGGEVRYTLYIANKSDSNADVRVEDTISSYLVETADGSNKTALESWTINAEFIANKGAAHNDASAIPTSGDIDAIVKLGAAGSEPTLLKIDIVGKVRDDAVGKFGNTLYVDKKQYDLQQHFIYPEPAAISVTKTPSISPAVYAPGDSIGFDIVIENTGGGFAKGLRVEDIAKSIKADVVNSIVPGQVFDSWDASKSSISIIDSGSPSVTISQSPFDADNGFTGEYNLAPGSTLNLHLEGTVASNVVGAITNQVKVSAQGISEVNAEATYQPIDAEVTVSKTVDKAEYITEDILTYTIVLTNTQKVWATDVQVTDLVDRITAETIFGNSVSVFKPGTIDITGTSANGTTNLPSLSDDHIDNSINISPLDIITVKIQGELKPEIIGDVINTISVDYDGKTLEDSATSVLLVPEIEIVKEPIQSTYQPGTNNGFTISVINKGDAFANDIKLEDKISALQVEVTDGSMQPAFTRWVTSFKSGDPRTQVGATVFGWNQDIAYDIDLAPKDTIVFTVEGEVNPKAVGDIDNVATANFNGKDLQDDAQLVPEKSALSIEKVADREFYQAGQPAQFVVTVTNQGKGFANDVIIQDLMSDVLVDLVDGTKGTAFESWSITTYASNANTSLSTTPSGTNPDIDLVLILRQRVA